MKYLAVLTICFSTLSLAQAGSSADGVQPAALSAERQAELSHLLRHDCGSCHGMTLKGGLGPALTPDVLSNKPEEYLFHVISYGRQGTPMPPWQGILSDDDIRWLVDALKEGVDS
ncbi:c-type cytochrome [Aliamphritea hakodatensis]|uniref:c-type cytochrome n=1 Tax=Aliamphritea hakodatensis TaxID=2895352 RepID=UPI0022FD8DE0|nr:cytochrome c [Aliamphritea hakodatensis]